MTASFESQQTTIEREFAVPPSEANPLVQPHEQPRTLDTSEVIIPGYDKLSEPEPYADKLRSSINESTANLEFDLLMRVKNELITQIFIGENPQGYVDINSVAQTLEVEFSTQKQSNARSLNYLLNTVIPDAQLREEPDYMHPRKYSVKDLGNLYLRAEAHHYIDAYIGAVQEAGEDSLRDLAEHYIAETLPAAQDAALKALLTQKKALEKQKEQDDKKISQLSETIEILEGELKTARKEVEDRDVDLWEGEIEEVVPEYVR